jgi:very-short-patch-repair endonuclease
VLRLEDLPAAGLSREEIRTRVTHGRLQRLRPAVFVVGPTPPEPLSSAHGAALSCGDRGYVDHRWATFAHGFGDEPPLPVDVLVTGGSRRGREGFVVVHRSRHIAPCDIGHLRDLGDLAVTSPARAILDCGDFATVSQIEGLIADALVAKVVTKVQLEEVLSRARRRQAAARLRAALADSPGITRSEAERILQRLLRQARLPQPVTGYAIGPYEADCAWPRLIVEFDIWTYHGGKPAFHHDRERAAYLTARGWSILRSPTSTS